MMKEQSPEALKSLWHARLPGQIPERLVIAEELADNVVKLEGQDLISLRILEETGALRPDVEVASAWKGDLRPIRLRPREKR